MGLADNFAKIRQVLILRSEKTFVRSLGLAKPGVAGGWRVI